MNYFRVHGSCNAGLLGYVVVLYFGVQIGNKTAYSGSFYESKGLKIRLGEQTLIDIDIEYLPGRTLKRWQVNVP